MQGFGFIHFPSAAAAAKFYTNPPSVAISGRERPPIPFVTRLRLISPFGQVNSCSDRQRTILQPNQHSKAPNILQSTRLLQAGEVLANPPQLPQLHKLPQQRALEAAGKNQR